MLSVSGPRGASAREPVSWFRNAGGKQFTAAGPLPAPREMYRGLVAADLNNDGCLDLVATALNTPARLLRNACRGNWLKVDVQIPGARVKVAGQWRQVSTSVGYASSCACPLHFGLGDAATVDVEVQIPGGQARRFPAVKANQLLVVKP